MHWEAKQIVEQCRWLVWLLRARMLPLCLFQFHRSVARSTHVSQWHSEILNEAPCVGLALGRSGEGSFLQFRAELGLSFLQTSIWLDNR